MLLRLSIKNIALISHLDVEFVAGLNILTGETGAGKSIIIDAINLALGEKAEYELLKHGETKASVEAEFDISGNIPILNALNSLDIETEDDTLIVSRELNASGRSVCRLNGTVVSRSSLKNIMDFLVDVHGQHEHQSLLAPKYHIQYLDAYAKDSLAQYKEIVNHAYDRFKSLEHDMEVNFLPPDERERRIDTLTYQINEIESINPMTGEDDELLRTRDMLMNAERIALSLTTAYDALYGGESNALSAIKSALVGLNDIKELSDSYSALQSKCDEAFYIIEDIAFQVREQKEVSNFEFSDLEQVEERLNVINSLKRKYGGTIDSVLQYAENARMELERIQNSADAFERNTVLINKYREDYYTGAEQLTIARKHSAEHFCAEVLAELRDLGLQNASLTVRFDTESGDVPSRNGIDKVEFLLSANSSEPEKPLAKVASGGEISRIMLALKTVLSHVEGISIMIFDEIDTGISGETATTVGLKMHYIAKGKQVIAITHLPQIAAFADAHYLVEKTEQEGIVRSDLKRLTDEEHKTEIARIMGGTHSRAALEHASAMISEAIQKISKY